MTEETKSPSLLDALIPIFSLIIMLIFSVYLYGGDSSYGANQIALITAAGIAAIIGVKNGYRWKTIEEGIVKGISSALGAILILLAVGSLIGSWILSGTVPTMIYFGLQALDPSVFYVATCFICALVSISIGSSWTTAGTVGVALIGVATGLGLSVEITAGAIISGAYFGDKMSPLSDTTNLAPAVSGTELFDHIRHMTWTTVPSFIITLVAFFVIGIAQSSTGEAANLQATLSTIEQHFNVSVWTLIPLVLVLTLAVKKFPAFPTIFIGALVGGLFAVILQPDAIMAFVGKTENITMLDFANGVWKSLATGYSIETENAAVNDLLSRGGMNSMLNTVWLIISAMTFGAVLEHTRLLERLVIAALRLVHGTGSLIITTILTCIGTNIMAADQYISIVLPGRMYRAEFKRRGLDPKNLSRALEDSATITSPLIPWNTCGAYMAGTLGVATSAYMFFCFFNWLTPIVSALYGAFNFKIEKLPTLESAESTA